MLHKTTNPVMQSAFQLVQLLGDIHSHLEHPARARSWRVGGAASLKIVRLKRRTTTDRVRKPTCGTSTTRSRVNSKLTSRTHDPALQRSDASVQTTTATSWPGSSGQHSTLPEIYHHRTDDLSCEKFKFSVFVEFGWAANRAIGMHPVRAIRQQVESANKRATKP